MRIPAVIAICVVLGACGPVPVWTRPNTSPEQTERDLTECRMLAFREARYEAFYQYPFYPSPYYGRWGWPYYSRPYPFGYYDYTFVREHQLTHFCMQARGYYLAAPTPAIEAPPPPAAYVAVPPRPEDPYEYGWVDRFPPERPSGPFEE